MKILIITVAGSARRFNRDLEEPNLKCIFYKEKPQYSLLYQIFSKSSGCDRIIVVGGFEYKQLTSYIETYLSEYAKKIETIYNPHFEDYATGYSLYLGINAAQKMNADEIIFVEGDLFFTKKDFKKVLVNRGDVFTINKVPIESGKAVVVYQDISGHIKYLYDQEHKELFIKEPFLSVYNSAQIWKFTDPFRLYKANEKVIELHKKATNLDIINCYFSEIAGDEFTSIIMNTWINCNTVRDYDIMLKHIKRKGA
ncbi:MAG: hypothetical protein LBI14_00535 [Treponema sp.]|nr:hypothetical protein [Treponema sp.]